MKKLILKKINRRQKSMKNYPVRNELMSEKQLKTARARAEVLKMSEHQRKPFFTGAPVEQIRCGFGDNYEDNFRYFSIKIYGVGAFFFFFQVK